MTPQLLTPLNTPTLNVANVNAALLGHCHAAACMQPTAADIIRCYAVYGLTNNYSRKGLS